MCCHAVSLRTFTSLWLFANQAYLYFRQQLWPLELLSVPLSESSGSVSAGHARRPLVSQFTSQRTQRKAKEQKGGEKLSGDVSTKSYYTQKVILVYLSSLLSLLVQAYRNSPIWFFFSSFFSNPASQAWLHSAVFSAPCICSALQEQNLSSFVFTNYKEQRPSEGPPCSSHPR